MRGKIGGLAGWRKGGLRWPKEAILQVIAVFAALHLEEHSFPTMSYLNSRPQTPKVCPVCGEDVPPRALACPECGADHNSGWKEEADATGGLDLPEDDFNYDEFIKDEFGPGRSSGIKPIWWITAIVLLVGGAVWYLLRVL